MDTDMNQKITIYDYSLKFIIVGDAFVGKSNILSQFANNQFNSHHDITIGVDFVTKIILIHNTVYKIQIWDTQGQETYRPIIRAYYKNTIGCLMVYDVTNRTSFNSLIFWYAELKKYCDPDNVIVLVGNKIDNITDRCVSTDEGKEFADKHKISFFETSAKTGDNVFNCIVDTVKNIKKY